MMDIKSKRAIRKLREEFDDLKAELQGLRDRIEKLEGIGDHGVPRKL